MYLEPPKEAVLQAYDEAPQYVKNAFVSEKTTEQIVAIRDAHQLHVDVAGILGKQVGYLLLGLVDPQTFLNNLMGAGMSREVASSIVKEINEKIFQPLQKEAREGAPTTIPRPAEPTPESMKIPEATSTPTPPAPEIPPMKIGEPVDFPQNLPGQMPAPQWAPPAPPMPSPVQPVYTSPPTYPPQPQYQAPAPPPIYSAPPPQAEYHPAARTMESDMAYAQQGMYPPQMPQYAPPPQPVYAAPAPVPPPAPRPAPPPPPQMAPVRLTPVDSHQTSAPIKKEFGSDPYREAIE